MPMSPRTRELQAANNPTGQPVKTAATPPPMMTHVGREFAQYLQAEDQAEAARRATFLCEWRKRFRRTEEGHLIGRVELWMPDRCVRLLVAVYRDQKRGGWSILSVSADDDYRQSPRTYMSEDSALLAIVEQTWEE